MITDPNCSAMEPALLPPAPRTNGVTFADIAADDVAPPSPSVAASPHRLFSRDRGSDAKKSRDARPSPRRRTSHPAAAAVTVPSPSDVSVWKVFAPSPPRPAPPRQGDTVVSVDVTPEQAKRLQDVVAAIRAKPLSHRRAILPTKKGKPPSKSTSTTAAKATKPAKKSAQKKNNSILGSNIFAIDGPRQRRRGWLGRATATRRMDGRRRTRRTTATRRIDGPKRRRGG